MAFFTRKVPIASQLTFRPVDKVLRAAYLGNIDFPMFPLVRVFMIGFTRMSMRDGTEGTGLNNQKRE
jgi:hypothetical protein